MKKLLTVLFSFGLLTTVVAQSKDYRNDRDDKSNTYHNGNHRPQQMENVRKRDQLIFAVNEKYNARIDRIRGRRRMSPSVKENMIRDIQQRRMEEISSINARYGVYGGAYGRNERKW